MVMTTTQENRIYASAAEAVADVFSGAMVCVGGFGPVRNRAVTLCQALAERTDVKDITLVANSFPHQPLAENKLIKKFIGAFGGSVYRRAAASEEGIRSGEIEFEPSPQGILTERLRAGGGGIPAFFSPVGVHTVVADGKERRTIDGKEYILETALKPDFGLIRAEKADELGNLTGVGSTLNFHPAMAAASKITIAEVDEIVPVGSIAPEDVKIPGIYVDRIVVRDPELTKADEAGRDHRRARRDVPTRCREGRPLAGPDGAEGRHHAQAGSVREPGHGHPDEGRQLHPPRLRRPPSRRERLPQLRAGTLRRGVPLGSTTTPRACR